MQKENEIEKMVKVVGGSSDRDNVALEVESNSQGSQGQSYQITINEVSTKLLTQNERLCNLRE